MIRGARGGYRFGPFLLLSDDKQLLHDGRPVHLPPKAFDTLLLLVENHGRLIQKDEFLARVWADSFVEDVVLPHTISQVRRVLAERAPEGTFVQTVSKRGYRFVAAVEAVVLEPAAVAAVSIAVLPFINLSEQPENDYFSDGLTEEILSVLAKDPALRVAARSSSFAFKGKPVDLADVAQRLGVQVVLEGSVRRAGNRVRITAQLVDVVDRSTWWSQSFDRDLSDIFAVQEDVAAAVAGAIRRTSPTHTHVGLHPTDAGNLRRHRVSLEAYDEYLKGRQLNHRRIEGMRQARAHFERALTLEPTFAPAHSGLAQSYCWFGVYGAMPSNEAFVGTRRHAERALELDPGLADAHHLLGYVALWFEWDAAACQRHIARTLTIELNHADGLMLKAHLAIAQCRVGEALASSQAALATDPLGLSTRTNAAYIAFMARDFERLIRDVDRLIAEYPTFSEAYRLKALALTMQKDYGAGQSVYERTVELSGGHSYATLGLAANLALQGFASAARDRLDRILARADREWILPMGVAMVYGNLGDYDAALTWLERAYQSRDFMMPMLHVWPGVGIVPPGRTTPLCDEPRFRDLVHRVGMAPTTWRECVRFRQ